ncbi:primosomal protein N' [Streptomyces tanashiensis]
MECGSTRLRARIVGARRTAEELGRAFPAVPVRTSGRDHVLDSVPGRPALVVSTPGAEPVAEGGYAAALLLDGWAMLGRPDLRAGEEALRRWIDAASLVRGQPEGGTVVVVAEPTLRPVQALVRWDPVLHARRELAERAELGFPPVSRMAAVSGPPEAVEGFLAGAGLPADAEVLGPVPLPVVRPGGPRRPGDPPPGEQWERALVRVPPGSGAALAASLKQARAGRLARGGGDPVRIRVEPAGHRLTGTPPEDGERPPVPSGGRAAVGRRLAGWTVARAGGRSARGSSRRRRCPGGSPWHQRARKPRRACGRRSRPGRPPGPRSRPAGARAGLRSGGARPAW